MPSSESTLQQQPQPRQKPLKLLMFGTHPQQYNGYSKVVYELISELSAVPDLVQVYVFGFQNLYSQDRLRPNIPDNVTIYDPWAEESPKKQGFGIELVKSYVSLCNPDVCLVFNDLSIITAVLNELKDVPGRSFKIITYIDQVYLSQRKAFIEFVNQHADMALLFSPAWQKCIHGQGLRLPSDHLPHGINTSTYFPIPKHLARKYYGFADSDFLILNLNRNQPRKRWDVCIMALAELVSRHPKAPIKLIVATEAKGAWNLPELYERELRKRGVDLTDGLKHIVFVDSPQRMTDREVNMLYNVCDIGINCCDGEGFGLCNFEQAALGRPQVVPALGAFPDMFDDDSAVLVRPCCSYYLDASRDAMGGEALMCDAKDFANGMERYFLDPELRERHGRAARQRIVRSYRWRDIAAKLVDVVRNLHGPLDVVEEDVEYERAHAPVAEAVEVDEVRALLAKDDADDKCSPEPSTSDFSFHPKPDVVPDAQPHEPKKSNKKASVRQELEQMRAMMARLWETVQDEEDDD